MHVRRLAKHECGNDDSGKGFDEVTYYVRGEVNSSSVLTAVDSDDPTVKIPQRFEVHPDQVVLEEDATHFCTSRRASWLGIRDGEDEYIVTCTFKTATWTFEGGDGVGEFEYEWDVRTETVSDPTDIDGNVIVNAAGDPIDGGAEKSVKVLVLHVYKRNDSYDPELAMEIVDAVNELPIYILDSLSLEAGQMRCAAYVPTIRQVYGNVRGEVTKWTFEIKKGYRPWDDHRANVGYNGWRGTSEDPVKGPFVHGETGLEQLIDTPVMLDTTGIPIDFGNIRIGRYVNGNYISSHLPVTNPHITEIEFDPEATGPTGWMEFRATSDGKSSEAIAKTKERYDFIGLFPFFVAEAP